MLQTEITTIPKKNISTHMIDDTFRSQLLVYSKDFKTSWVKLGQILYSVWRDKTYHSWGFDKFEEYAKKELGLSKSLATKLLKTYLFLEEDEPEYLGDKFSEENEAVNVPGYEEMNFLRLAKNKKEVLKDDYRKFRKDIFEIG